MNTNYWRSCLLLTLVILLGADGTNAEQGVGSLITTAHLVGSSARDSISPLDNHPRKTQKVIDSYIRYVDEGKGDPIVFLHGNPTWSYLWRNVITPLTSDGRCLAPDLIGMGQSGKSTAPKDAAYRFADQYHYLEAWFDSLHLTKVTLVLHDWGSALGFYWASLHPDRVKAIAYMEAIVADRSWAEFGEFETTFRAFRSPAGEDMVLGNNVFIEQVLPHAIIRPLSTAEMIQYRAPFQTRESRWPTLQWPRQIPVEGQPEDVLKVVNSYAAWLRQSNIPKLYFDVQPGTIPGSARTIFASLPHQQTVVVKGIHYVQEDAPTEISDALKRFIKGL